MTTNASKKSTNHNEALLRKRTLMKYANGGRVVRFVNGDYNQSDMKNLINIAGIWARRYGSTVQILPRVHRRNANYNYIFGELKGTIYDGKCPDLKIITHIGKTTFVEYESFVSPYRRRKLSEMISRGAIQSQSIIIDIRETTITRKEVVRTVLNMMHNKGMIVKTIWAYDGKALQRFWHKKGRLMPP